MKPLDTKSKMIVKKGPHAPGLSLSCFTSEIKETKWEITAQVSKCWELNALVFLWPYCNSTQDSIELQPSADFLTEFGNLSRNASYKVLGSCEYLMDRHQTITQKSGVKETWLTFFREVTHQGGVCISLTFVTWGMFPEAPRSCVTTLHSPPVTFPPKTPAFPSTLKPMFFLSLGKLSGKRVLLQQEGTLCTETSHDVTARPGASAALSLAALIPHTCCIPWAPVLGSSYSLSLCSIHRHTQTALTQLQGGAQPDALLSHPQAQLTNAEAPAHADSSEAQTGTNPPSWDPFLTDTVMLPPGHAPGTLTHLQAMSCTLFLALVWNWVEILIDAVLLVH